MTFDTQFREEGQWTSPLFAGVHFFEIMVLRSLYKNIRWHMWLYYLRDVVRRCEENYAPRGADYDPQAEFPIRYSYLIYRIFTALRDFIEPVSEPEIAQQANTQLERVAAVHENHNIPKSAIRALIESHRILIASDKIENDFKCYITRIIFDLYFDLAERGAATYAATLLAHMKSDAIHPATSASYFRHLRDCYNEYDIIPHEQHKEPFVDALFPALAN